MSSTAAQLFEQALDLSDEERAELIVRLLDTVSDAGSGVHDQDDSRGTIEASWMEEARRRLGDIESGRVSPVPWSEARERMFARKP